MIPRVIWTLRRSSDRITPTGLLIGGRFFSPLMPTATHPDPSPPDSVLISRFQSGEPGVFDQLYLRHHDRIHAVILGVVLNPDDALDLTQEVFLKAYQKLSGFQRASQFYSWLYRIAVNQCIDFMRRQSKHHVLIDEPFREEIYCPAAVLHLKTLQERRDARYSEWETCVESRRRDCPRRCCDTKVGNCYCVIEMDYPPPYKCACWPSGSGS